MSQTDIIIFPVENANAADHPGGAHVGGDKIQCFFQISDVVDLGNAFLSFLHKGIHVAVQTLSGRRDHGKGSAALYDAQYLPHDIALVPGRWTSWKGEVADGGVRLVSSA